VALLNKTQIGVVLVMVARFHTRITLLLCRVVAIRYLLQTVKCSMLHLKHILLAPLPFAHLEDQPELAMAVEMAVRKLDQTEAAVLVGILVMGGVVLSLVLAVEAAEEDMYLVIAIPFLTAAVAAALDFWGKALPVVQEVKTALRTEGSEAQAAQMAQMVRRVSMAMEEIMVAVRLGQPQENMVNPVQALYGSFGPERLAPSHQLTQVICNGTLYSYC
jgi:hypothetical protein